MGYVYKSDHFSCFLKLEIETRDYVGGLKMVRCGLVSLSNSTLKAILQAFLQYTYMNESCCICTNCTLIHSEPLCLCPNIMSIIHSISPSLSVCRSGLLRRRKSHQADSTLSPHRDNALLICTLEIAPH